MLNSELPIAYTKCVRQHRWKKGVLLRSWDDWHLNKVDFFKGSEWSDRKDEGKWKEEERGKIGQCKFMIFFFFGQVMLYRYIHNKWSSVQNSFIT